MGFNDELIHSKVVVFVTIRSERELYFDHKPLAIIDHVLFDDASHLTL